MAAHADELPREFGKYHLIERIATGGMAELYLAKLYGAGGFEKDLAIKKVLPHLAQDQAFVQMFMDEAMITVTLNHGNIVQVIDFGELEGEYFLVMEFIDGVDLQLLIKRGAESYDPIPVGLSVYVAEQICRGLHYAHEKLGPDGNTLQIVHRDVSPQNVLLSFEGQVKLVDFGIARAASRISSTQAGVVKGKLAYMSPEQLTGQVVDRRSDVFAAGIILYEMLTNHRPFEGATPHETMALISRGKYQEPQKLNRHVPRKLAKLVAKALETNPKKRFPTAGALANELSAFLHSEGNPPESSTLAAFIHQRCPDSRPRALVPTPNRFLRRELTPPLGTGRLPVSEPDRPAPAAAVREPTPAPPAVATPALSFKPASPRAAPPPADATDSSAVVVADEAVAFGVLGLPDDYAVAKRAAEARRTEPELPRSEPPEEVFDDRPTDPKGARRSTAPGLPQLSPAAPAQAVGGRPVDPELLAAPTRILEPGGGQVSPRPATSAPVAGEFQVPDLSHRTDQELLQAPTVIKGEPPAPDLLDAQTRIREAAPATPDTPSGPEVSDQMRAWMERGPEREPDFEDEAPDQRPRSSGRGPGLAIALVLILVLAALAVYVFLVWKPFGPRPAPDAGQGVTEIAIQGGLDAGSAVPGPAGAGLEVAVDAGLELVAADAGSEVAADPGPAVPGAADAGAAAGVEPAADGGTAVAMAPDAGVQAPPTGADAAAKPPKPVAPKPAPPKPALPKPAPPKPAPPKPAVAAAKGTGTLRINSEPFAMVYLGAKRLGPTPQMDVKLPAGSHVLTLKNEALGITKKVRVRIEPDKVHTVFVELAK